MTVGREKEQMSSIYKPNRSYRHDLGGHYRCTICNTVSTEEIETEIGDFKGQMSFTNDPNDRSGLGLSFICVVCSDAVNDTINGYPDDDE